MDGNLLENVERKSCVTPRPRPGASVTMVSGSQENSISTDVLFVSSTALKMEIFVKCMKVKWQNNWKHLALKWLSTVVTADRKMAVCDGLEVSRETATLEKNAQGNHLASRTSERNYLTT